MSTVSDMTEIWLDWWASDATPNLRLRLPVFVVLAFAQSTASTLNMW